MKNVSRLTFIIQYDIRSANEWIKKFLPGEFSAQNFDIYLPKTLSRKRLIMKLIKPSEISAKILTLLDESDERVIIVSPYLKISKWYKLTNRINALKTRGIQMDIYIRDDPDNSESYKDLDQLDLDYKKIPHLHCKLFLNERYGIVTSMNLLLSSEFNSLEIGYVTESWEEYSELNNFYQRYIHMGEPLLFHSFDNQPASDLKEFKHQLRNEIEKNRRSSWLWLGNNILYISTGNKDYTVSTNDSFLRITTSTKMPPGSKQRTLKHLYTMSQKVSDLSAMKIQVHAGPAPDRITISGQAKRKLKSQSITKIIDVEERYIIESLLRFINATDDL